MKTVEELLKDSANWAKGFTTRDGRAVRILCLDLKGKSKRVVGAVTDSDGRESVHIYNADGSFIANHEYELDLTPRPVKRKGWLNIYDFALHQSKQKADHARGRGRGLGCIEVEFEEGQGL